MVAIYKRTGKKPKPLALEPKILPGLAEILAMFYELKNSAGFNSIGFPNSISFGEILSCGRVYGIKNLPMFSRIIKRIDYVYSKELRDKKGREK